MSRIHKTTFVTPHNFRFDFSGLTARATAAGAKIVTSVEGADVVLTCGGSWSSEGNDRKTLKVDQVRH